MRDRRDGVDIRNVGIGIAQRFQINRLSVGLNGSCHFFQIVCIHKCRFNAVERKGVCQQIVTAAIDRFLRDDVITLLRQCLDDIGHSRCTGSKSQSAHAPLQSGKSLFQNILCGIGETSVDISRIRQAETCRRVGGIVEDIGGCLIDGNCAGIGSGIGLLLADMKLQRFKFIVRHDDTSFFNVVFVFLYHSRKEVHIRPFRKLCRSNCSK